MHEPRTELFVATAQTLWHFVSAVCMHGILARVRALRARALRDLLEPTVPESLAPETTSGNVNEDLEPLVKQHCEIEMARKIESSQIEE